MELIKIFERAEYLRNWSGALLFTEYLPDDKKAFHSYDTSGGLVTVDENLYSIAMAGQNYQRIEQALRRKIHFYVETDGLDGERFFCFYQENIIHGFDRDGTRTFEWNVNELTQGHTVDDIKFEPLWFLWLAAPTGQTVSKVSLKDKQEVFRIGEYTYDDVYDPLDYPESLFITDSHLFISNMGSHKVSRLDLKSLSLELVRKFEEPVWEYIIINDVEYVSLQSGVFMIKDESM